MRIDVHFEDEEAEWIKRTAKRDGLSTAAFLRNLCLEHRLALELGKAAEPKKKPPTLKEKFLARVRENNSLIRSAVDLKIPTDTVREWQQDPAFCNDLRAAQVYWVDGIQDELRLIGAGKKKGDANALARILAAHHAAFGRAKKELILRILDPLIKRYTNFVRQELGQGAEEGLQKALARFDVEKRKRLSDIT